MAAFGFKYKIVAKLTSLIVDVIDSSKVDVIPVMMTIWVSEFALSVCEDSAAGRSKPASSPLPSQSIVGEKSAVRKWTDHELDLIQSDVCFCRVDVAYASNCTF